MLTREVETPADPVPREAGIECRRVLLLVRTLGLGGMERMTVNLANALHRQGHEVHILVFKNRIEINPEPGVHVQVVDFDRFFRLTIVGALYDLLNRTLTRFFVPRAKHVFYSVYFSRLFRLWLALFERRHGRVDLMVARGYGSFQGLAGFTDDRLVRIVVNELWESPDDIWHRRFFRSSFHRTNVVFNSRAIEQDFIRLCSQMDVRPASTRVLNNPTDLGRIRRDAEEPPLLDGPYIVNIGRLEKAKNQQLLLNAFAHIHDRIPHRLLIIGKGSLERSLRDLAASLGIKERVVFAGQQRNPYPSLRHADLFVLTSLHEGLPNVVIESLVCGTPVVVARGKGGTVELMRGDLREFIAEMDADSLAAKMLAALEKPPRIDPALVETFSMDAVAKDYLAMVAPR